ncbi:MAG: radical SAM protein [Candidatus Lokiarchaeota archaeon]|nr:radical SAM protein [Candidatus Lokiarchaeota archaeon]
MKFVYGPVPSRRLGRSLGIDPLPSKTCNYQCIYCQLGKTTCFTNRRSNFYPKEEIISEIKTAIELNEDNIDYVTFVGSGEPTLYKDLKELIQYAKKISNKPICVITNGSLLNDEGVVDALLLSNVVLPSLDAGDELLFKKVNRPHPSLKFEKIIQGFIDFRKNFRGKFWIEIMLMKEINDSRNQLKNLKEKIDLIQPDRIDINVPIRPPTEKWVKIPDKQILSRLNEIFIECNCINFPEEGTFLTFSSDFEKELLSVIKRHPLRQEQIIMNFSSTILSENHLKQLLYNLESERKIKRKIYNNQIFWMLY